MRENNMRIPAWCVFLFGSVLALHAVADWPAWRGPLQNGMVKDAAMLREALPTNAWNAVWESEPIPGDTEGGFGSPVVADGRVYLFCSWRIWSNVTERCLAANKAGELGLVPAGIGDSLLAEIEAARVSPERAALKGPEVGKWSKDWVAARPTVTQQVAVARFAEDRLSRGEKALPIDGLRMVTQLVGRVFSDQAALVAWFEQHSLTNSLRDQIDQRIPKKTSRMDDVILCLDAVNGRTLWKKSYPGQASDWGSSSTPCVAGGRVFVMGSSGMAYGFDARTGDLQWTNAVTRQAVNASFAAQGGKLFILAGQLLALDPATGKVQWTQKAVSGVNASPVMWDHAGKSYVLAGGSQVACADPDDGKLLWKVPGSDSSTPAVSGDSMAVQYGGGLLIYSLSPTGAVKVADVKSAGSRGASAVAADGKAYTTCDGKAVCVDLATGAMVWQVNGTHEPFASPLLANGKLVALGAEGKLSLFSAADGRLLGSAKVGSLRCTSPALVGTRLFVRTGKGVSCYELGP